MEAGGVPLFPCLSLPFLAAVGVAGDGYHIFRFFVRGVISSRLRRVVSRGFPMLVFEFHHKVLQALQNFVVLVIQVGQRLQYVLAVVVGVPHIVNRDVIKIELLAGLISVHYLVHFLVEFQEGCHLLLVSEPERAREHFNDVEGNVIAVIITVKQAVVEQEVKELVGGDSEEHGELPRAHGQQLLEVVGVDAFFEDSLDAPVLNILCEFRTVITNML